MHLGQIGFEHTTHCSVVLTPGCFGQKRASAALAGASGAFSPPRCSRTRGTGGGASGKDGATGGGGGAKATGAAANVPIGSSASDPAVSAGKADRKSTR